MRDLPPQICKHDRPFSICGDCWAEHDAYDEEARRNAASIQRVLDEAAATPGGHVGIRRQDGSLDVVPQTSETHPRSLVVVRYDDGPEVESVEAEGRITITKHFAHDPLWITIGDKSFTAKAEGSRVVLVDDDYPTELL